MDREVKPVESGKKPYTTPRLVHHGDVDEITRSSGVGFADVPFGNPAGAPPDGIVVGPFGGFLS